MIPYLLRRVATSIPVLLGISFITFALITFAPGDAISVMLSNETANAANLERLEAELGLNDPWYTQYFNYMAGLFQGDFGTSITSRQPVLDQIMQRFPNTLMLTFSAMLVALVIAIPVGTLSAARQSRPEDYGAMAFSMLGVAMPNFWLGLILILFFGLELRWLPIRGMGSLEDGLWDFVSHLILPALTLGTALAAILTRLTRNAVLDVLSEDYVRTAKAKGLRGSRVSFQARFTQRDYPRGDHRWPTVWQLAGRRGRRRNDFFVARSGTLVHHRDSAARSAANSGQRPDLCPLLYGGQLTRRSALQQH